MSESNRGQLDAAPGITLRQITDEDMEFLLKVYASTRVEELSMTGWNQDEIARFLEMQFLAQHQYYQEYYAGAEFQVIFENGVPVGRLYVAELEDEYRLVDIALMPEYRGSGIGTRLIKALFDRAARRGKPVRIHVEKLNPALHLYERLGFSQIADKGVYIFMEWRPSP